MPRLPRVSGAQAIRALERLGFARVRQPGSHVVLKRVGPEKFTGCVVPLHSELATGTLRGILKLADITAQEFIDKLYVPSSVIRFKFALSHVPDPLIKMSR